MSLRLDDCQHCACYTELTGYTKESAIKALEDGDLGCQNCIEDPDEDGDGHTKCVSLLEDDKVVWQGGCRARAARRKTAAQDSGG